MGWSIFVPGYSQSRYDLLGEFENTYYKIQVKKASWSKSGPHKYLQTRLIGRNKVGRRYTKEEIDLFAVCEDVGKRIWIIPIEDVINLTSLCLDGSNTEYKSHKSYNPNTWLLNQDFT